ncbi:MAG TPA: DUF3592 domain-containing protein [Thermoanaerobaculia bacterium]|nr:DUF3592 domain-containing protein [Thermoanaerobaculia bacterium]
MSDRRIRPAWRLPFLGAVLVVGVLLCAERLDSAVRNKQKLASLSAHGVETTATVVETEIVRGRVIDSLRVHYRYDAAGREHEATYVVSGSQLQKRFVPGARVPVTYAAATPAMSMPVAKSELASPQVTARIRTDIPAMTLMLVAFAFMIVSMARRAVREYRFCRNGREATAKVLETSGTFRRRCRYRLSLPPATTEQTVRVYSNSFHPNAGDVIRVLVHTETMQSLPVDDLVYVRIRTSRHAVRRNQ